MGMGGNFNNGLSLMDNVADDLASLTSVGIDDGSDLRFTRDGVGDVEGGGTVEHAETIRKVVQVEGVAVDRPGEHSFRDGLESLVRV
jgi:hypothetical protein